VADIVLELFAVYGLFAIALIVAAGQLGVPLPTSIVLMTGGALQASGDLQLWQVFAVALTAAMAGDHCGYAVGRLAGNTIRARAKTRPRLEARLDKAEAFGRKWGTLGIFLSRWLVSPLGPYVNVTSGLTRHSLARFTAADLAGESIWVGGYVALGSLFAGQIATIADVIANASWLIGSVAVTGWLGWMMIKAARKSVALSQQERP
jgi:membrane protein DedA with SNARE-associated domain